MADKNDVLYVWEKQKKRTSLIFANTSPFYENSSETQDVWLSKIAFSLWLIQ